MRRSHRRLLRHFRSARRDAGALQRVRLLLSEARGRDVLLRVALLLALLQCSPAPRGNCAQKAVGDSSKPMALTVITIEPGGNVAIVNPGDPLYLQAPPQGGFVIYAGVAGTNLQQCDVDVRAELIDPVSGNAISNLDEREADLTAPKDGIYY